MGPWPPPLPQSPVIAYSNHHSFYDGHFAWLLFRRLLDRPPTIWMEKWDQFPFFAAVGAQPFPADDPIRRANTIRRTARRFRDEPRTVLVYYPEGGLHPPDDGIRLFEAASLQPLGDLYPKARWWPYAVRVMCRAEAKPTALVTGGAVHEPDGDERSRLEQLWNELQTAERPSSRVLLEGSPGPEERWDFSTFSSLFERYL